MRDAACLAAQRIAPRVAMEMPSNESIKQAVMAGMGLSFLSLHTIGLEVKCGLLAILDVAGLITLGFAGSASAAVVTYSSEAAFAVATGSTLHALPTGPGGSYVVGNSISSTDGVITLNTSTGSLVSNWESFPGVGVSRLGGPDLAISGRESFDVAVQFGADRYAFGFGIYESTDDALPGCNLACTESTFTITLWNDGVQLSPSYLLSPANDIAVFWGLQTDFAFDEIKIRETTGSNDNEIFGTFYSGTANVVPEPGSLALAGLALAGLGLVRRRRG